MSNPPRILYVQPVPDGWRIAFLADRKVVEVPLKGISVFEGSDDSVHMGYFVGNGTFATNLATHIHSVSGEFHTFAIQVLAPNQRADAVKLQRETDEEERRCNQQLM
jgi:hypothetical protein